MHAKSGLLAPAERLEEPDHRGQVPPGTTCREPQTLPRLRNCGPSLAKHVPSGPNTLPTPRTPLISAPPQSSGLCCRVGNTTLDLLLPFMRDPESQNWNGGNVQIDPAETIRNPPKASAQPAALTFQEGLYPFARGQPGGSSQTCPQRLRFTWARAPEADATKHTESGNCRAQRARPFNLRGITRVPPSGSDVRAQSAPPAPPPVAFPNASLGRCGRGPGPCDSERGCRLEPHAAF